MKSRSMYSRSWSKHGSASNMQDKAENRENAHHCCLYGVFQPSEAFISHSHTGPFITADTSDFRLGVSVDFIPLIGSKCCLLPFKVAPRPATLAIWLPYQLPFFPEIWWHSWIGSPVISPLERERRRGPGRRPLKILNGGGMPQWQEIFMARNTATASLERQTIYFSMRRCWWGGGGVAILMLYLWSSWLQNVTLCYCGVCETVACGTLWFLSLGRKQL